MSGEKSTTVTISIPQIMRDWVDDEIATGRYHNVSEYFRSLVRRDQDRAVERRLEAALLEGLDSGESIEVTPDFWNQLRKDLVTHVRKQQKTA